jgi:hypothetical protein
MDLEAEARDSERELVWLSGIEPAQSRLDGAGPPASWAQIGSGLRVLGEQAQGLQSDRSEVVGAGTRPPRPQDQDPQPPNRGAGGRTYDPR